MSEGSVASVSWSEHAADRSPMVLRSRSRSKQQMEVIVEAAKRLIARSGSRFTTQELVKEAGVAIQTFYRHFAGKDQLLIAIMEDLISTNIARFEEEARHLPNPLDRLRYYVLRALEGARDDEHGGGSPRFVTTEHWRLYQAYPQEMEQATQAFPDLVARELRAAREAGLVTVADPEQSAKIVQMLVQAAFHHYALAGPTAEAESIGERVWQFCLSGLGVSPPEAGSASIPGTPAAEAAHGTPSRPSG
mgnify:CR=1 FL=1